MKRNQYITQKQQNGTLTNQLLFPVSYSSLKDKNLPRLVMHPFSSSLFSFVLKHKSFYISKGFEFECILTIYAN